MSGSNDLHPVPAVQAALVAYLQGLIPEMQISDEWPYANQVLKYPSLTITQLGDAARTPLMPETDSVGPQNDVGQVVANEITAEYDYQLQLDLWCADKLMRRQYTNSLLEAFRDPPTPSGANIADGLTLAVPDYYNVPARLEIVSHAHRDDEQSAQRQERRERIVLVVNVREITQRTYYAMKSIQTQVDVSESDESALDTANI